ncbi:MAG: hypothetical protein WKF87_12435 [Chryseolinea sp.]
MKTELLTGKIAAASLIACATLLFSCKEEDRLTASDTQEITEEAVTDSYFLDMDDMATVAIASPSENEYSGGRKATTITITDTRFCPGTVVTIVPDENSTSLHPKGQLTVDFGMGCNDQRGNLRTGKLRFTYDKWRFQPGSTVVTTTDNYTINGIKLEGTRTLTNINDESDESTDPRKFNVLLENGKATFLAEGTTAERESDITFSLYSPGDVSEDYLSIEPMSEASGTTRGGHRYQVDVFEALIYKRSCGIAVDGIKKYVLDADKEITIDYGSGACDKSVVVTVNGTSHTVTIE